MLGLFNSALKRDETIMAPATNVDQEQGILAAAFTVRAHASTRAAEIGVAAFRRALEAAGYAADRPGPELLVTAEPAEEETAEREV